MSATETLTARAPRRWSARAMPVCLLALVALILGTAVLVDVVVSSTTRRGSWLLGYDAARQWLERQPWDGLITLIVCGAIAAGGVITLVAALLPGQRDLLPMWSSDRLTVGYLSAGSAASALIASALNIDRVRSARVRLGRRRARVSFRIVTATREEYETVVAEADDALRRRFASFGLVRPARLKIDAPKFRPPPYVAPSPAPPAVPAGPENGR